MTYTIPLDKEEIDNRVWGMMIAEFSQLPSMRETEFVDEKTQERRKLTDEERYETIISLLEKGVIYVRALKNGKATIDPVLNDLPKENDVTWCIQLDLLKGRYKEMAAFQQAHEEGK